MRIRSTYHPDADPDSDFLFAADQDSTEEWQVNLGHWGVSGAVWV